MKNIITTLTVLILFGFNSLSQSGFLGSIYNVSFDINASPAIRDLFGERTKSKFIDDNTVEYRTNVLNFSFKLGIERVLNDKSTIGISFKNSILNINKSSFKGLDTTFYDYGYFISENNYDLFTPLKAKNYALTISYKKYFKGLSPIGKYFGFDLSFGSAKSAKNQNVSYGNENAVSANLLYDIYNITNKYETTIEYQGTVKSIVSMFTFGQTIPITRKIGLDMSMNIPILRVYQYNNSLNFGLLTNGTSTIALSSEAGLNRNMATALKRSDSFSLKIGIKYFL